MKQKTYKLVRVFLNGGSTLIEDSLSFEDAQSKRDSLNQTDLKKYGQTDMYSSLEIEEV